MLMGKAYAAAEAVGDIPLDTAANPAGAFGMQLLMILVLVALFYVLLIMPQQKRFKEHKAMLDALSEGEKVVTAGGLVGTVKALRDTEVDVDLGGTVVTALRSTIQQKVDDKK